MEFVLIPKDSFIMGTDCIPNVSVGCIANETPPHKVSVESFYMGKYEVTQEQWYRVMQSTPAYFNVGKVGSDTARYPVEQVSWNDVQEFIKRLNAMEKTDKYHLPTEAEWEYAARGGKDTVYFFGNDAKQLAEYAWFSENSNNMTHPVGQKKENPFGLHDILGNVWEWTCSDYTGSYDGSETKCSDSGNNKSLRGGSWLSNANLCRAALRYNNSPSSRDLNFGFRVLLVLP